MFSAEKRAPALPDGNGRVVFVGDSITGQGGGWINAGFVFAIRDALAAVHPGAKPDLVPLGGSGMGVNAWLGLATNPDKQKRDLDVKGVEVATGLSQPADVLVVMLGMNDILAPYVEDTDASLDEWLRKYRELVAMLRNRMHPRVIGLATITPQTEDPASPKNQVMGRMNRRIEALAKEIGGVVLPANRVSWEVLDQGRKAAADFHLAGDRIHPGGPGHLAIAIGMLEGLGELEAAAWLRDQPLAKALLNVKPSGASPVAPPPWLVASGLILHAWNDVPSKEDAVPGPIDLAIERGVDFRTAPSREGGGPLKWRTFQSSVNLSDGANPGSVDFAGITFGRNFEAGYGARWIRSDKARKLQLELKSVGVGSFIQLKTWLNGQSVYSGMITGEPRRQAVREVELRKGWNVLVFKSSHRTWQWQQSINLTGPDGSPPEGLEYRISPP